MQRRRAVDSSWLTTLGALLLLGAHAWLCWGLIGGWNGIKTRYPILRDDHTFNYYYAVTSRNYLTQHGSTAGYDPYFMSGYAKSIIFPSSSTLAEIVVSLFGGEHPERAYKLYVVIASMACPAVLWLAAWIWTKRAGIAAVALLLYLTFFWSDVGHWYVVLGMVPFVLGGALSVAATALLVRFLDPTSHGSLRSGLSWIAMTISITFASMVHLTVPIIVGPSWILFALSRVRLVSPVKTASLVVTCFCIVGGNLFWLWPPFALIATMGRTDSGFINPNVSERFLEILRGDRPIETILIGLTLLGLPLWRWRNGETWLAMAGPVLWSFFLGYPGGWFRFLDFLQPGRYTLYFFTFATLPAAFGVVFVWDTFRRRASSGIALLASVALWLAGIIGGVYLSRYQIATIVQGPIPQLPTTMPQHLEELVLLLRRNAKPGERVLFEDRNLGISDHAGAYPDPYQDYRIAPLLPLMTGLEIVGGPYLYTHNKANFTQVGDGKFFGESKWEKARFTRFAHDYDLSWIVCWTPQAQQFCEQHPALIEKVGMLGPSFAPIWIGRIKRDPNPAVIGSARVTASPGRIEVNEARPADGVLVLRYHWTPSLVSDPPLKIDPFPIAEDPVGLIRVHSPPEQFVITLDPWQLPQHESKGE